MLTLTLHAHIHPLKMSLCYRIYVSGADLTLCEVLQVFYIFRNIFGCSDVNLDSLAELLISTFIILSVFGQMRVGQSIFSVQIINNNIVVVSYGIRFEILHKE